MVGRLVARSLVTDGSEEEEVGRERRKRRRKGEGVREGEEEQGGGEEMGSISPTDPPVTCLLSHPPADHSTHLIPIRK